MIANEERVMIFIQWSVKSARVNCTITSEYCIETT